MWWDEYRNWINNRRRQALYVEVVMVAPLPTDLPTPSDPGQEWRTLHVKLVMAAMDHAEARSPRDRAHALAEADTLLDEYLARYGRPADTHAGL